MSAKLFPGAILIRYYIKLILSLMSNALAMAIYLQLFFRVGSLGLHPEKVYMGLIVIASFAATILDASFLLLIHTPNLERLFLLTQPVETPWCN